MGGAIACGLLARGHDPALLGVSHPSPALAARLQAYPGVELTRENRPLARKADVAVVAVKPWLAEEVVAEIAPELEGRTLVSVVAGMSAETLRRLLLPSTSAALAIPNIAAACGESMTFMTPVRGDTDPIGMLLSELGEVEVVDESLLPAATTLASCGIAYALRYIRAATEAGVELGFKASMAQAIVAQTVKGAAALLDDDPEAHAEALIDDVTTPGGLTIRGLNAMERAGFSAAVAAGLLEGRRRP